MTIARNRIAHGFAAYGIARPAANALEVDAPEGLALIQRDDVNLVVWRRGRAPEMADVVDAAPDGREQLLDEAPRLLRPGSLAAGVRALTRNMPSDGLPADIAFLAALFLQIAGAGAARVRLERVEGDFCRLFHTDAVGLRLLCSYAGPGTQWLPDAAVAREALGKGCNEAICRDPEAVRSVATGDVAILKGDAWPGGAGRGVVHRSPPLGRSGERRLLLTLDAA